MKHDNIDTPSPKKIGIIRFVYILIGCVSLILGVIGIFVPGLPTTPFLLLSSWLFYKSSARLHGYLHRNRWLGGYIRRFQEQQGVDKKTKLISILCMWTMILISAFCFFEHWHIHLLLLGLGAVGMCSILFLVPGVRKNRKE